MKPRHWLLLSAVLVVAVLLLGLYLHDEGMTAAPPSAAKTAASTPLSPRLPVQEMVAPPLPATDTALPEMPALTADAAQSMSAAREQGDARQPALQRDAPREMPTAQELADPEAYQRYESRQSQRLHKAFVQAADTEIPRLQKDIDRARTQGLSPEQLAEGEEKLRRIQTMRDQLQAEAASAP